MLAAWRISRCAGVALFAACICISCPGDVSAAVAKATEPSNRAAATADRASFFIRELLLSVSPPLPNILLELPFRRFWPLVRPAADDLDFRNAVDLEMSAVRSGERVPGWGINGF